ncbi:MAG: chemotaxis protein CheW [Planctomycetota bacterium]|nr:chemotaxis protein CheW [Planctomycetota bacterium]
MTAITPTTAPTDLEACGFLVGGHCFAVPSAQVAEVLHAGSITPVPLAADAIAGLIHLRGQIVPVIDMRLRLGLGDAPVSGGGLLVVRLGDDRYALRVDEVLDVERIPTDRIEPPSGSLVDLTTDPRTGVFAGHQQLVHLLDPQRIVNALLRPRSSSATRLPAHKQGSSHVGPD